MNAWPLFGGAAVGLGTLLFFCEQAFNRRITQRQSVREASHEIAVSRAEANDPFFVTGVRRMPED
jgi:hypothetical protein